MAGMAWLATTPRSSRRCCGPAIAAFLELPGFRLALTL
jgi:hypothetical protein